MPDGIRESMGMSPWQQIMATDSEATREEVCGISSDGDFCRLEASGQCPQESNNRARRQDVCPLYVEEDDEEIRDTPKPVAPDSGKDAFEDWFVGMTDAQPAREDISKQMRIVAHAAWNAALESKPAPEGEVKVTWRVSPQRSVVHDGEFSEALTSLHGTEEDALDMIDIWQREHAAISRLVKIETRETVVDTRKRGA